ncbi:MAG: luciferase family protein [Nitrososphaera sp.]
METPSELVRRELQSLPGVTLHDHRFGGIEFRVNGREMGHMHGDRIVDLPFPKDIRKKLIAQGKASPHHFLPQSGWISYYIDEPGKVAGAVELFRMQYERMTSYGKKKIDSASSLAQTQ